jgi:hypothetical protein
MDRPFLKDALLALRDELGELLNREDEKDFIPQLDDLQIYGRCQCDSKSCSTFYSAPPPEGSYGPDHRSISLGVDQGCLIIDVVADRIVCIEVLDRPDVEQQLKSVLG